MKVSDSKLYLKREVWDGNRKNDIVFKSRKRITSTSLLCYINGLLALTVFYALKYKIGGHASTIEEKVYGIMLTEVIVTLMTCIGVFFAQKEIKMVIEKE